jgi:DNA-binding MarR family transcriptional regulator
MVPTLATKDDPMTKLSDTQSIILSAAAQRDDGNVLPLPGSLRGGAAGKVVGALLSRGLIVERVTDSMAKADPVLNRIWRNEPDGRGVLLTITPAGLDAIGIETTADPEAPVEHRIKEGTNSAGEPAAGAPTGAEEAPVDTAPKRRRGGKKAATTGADTTAPRKTRDGTKQAQVIAMLRRPEGATIAQIAETTDWRSHTVRGFFAGALKKKLGLEVTSEKGESGERTYRLPPA